MDNIERFERVRQELEEYGNLMPGWDGYSAEVANKLSINDTRKFLTRLPNDVPVMKVMLASDGEVSLFWDTEGMYLEVSFPGDGTYHWIYNSAKIRFGIDNLDLNTLVLDQRLLGILKGEEPLWDHPA